jgi:hypothetical protein
MVVDQVHAGDDHDECKQSHQCKEKAAVEAAMTMTIRNRQEEQDLPTTCYIHGCHGSRWVWCN